MLPDGSQSGKEFTEKGFFFNLVQMLFVKGSKKKILFLAFSDVGRDLLHQNLHEFNVASRKYVFIAIQKQYQSYQSYRIKPVEKALH